MKPDTTCTEEAIRNQISIAYNDSQQILTSKRAQHEKTNLEPVL